MRGKSGWVVAVCAIVLSITGTATAAKLITGKQIKNETVTGQDVRNRSLAASDLSSAARTALKGEQGPAGPAGPAGAAGAAGAVGPAGPAVASIQIVQASTTLCSGTSSCSIGSAEAKCPAGTMPVGGGTSTTASPFIFSISNSPGYIVAADNYGSSSTSTLNAFAYCSPEVKKISFPNGTSVGGRSAAQAGISAEAVADAVERRLAAKG